MQKHITGLRTAAVALSIATVSLSITGCSATTIPTCSEYAAMADDTGLMSSTSDEQVDALQAALDEEGYETGAYNVSIAATEVVAYCNIYDGVANSNQDQPINNGIL